MRRNKNMKKAELKKLYSPKNGYLGYPEDSSTYVVIKGSVVLRKVRAFGIIDAQAKLAPKRGEQLFMRTAP